MDDTPDKSKKPNQEPREYKHIQHVSDTERGPAGKQPAESSEMRIEAEEIKIFDCRAI